MEKKKHLYIEALRVLACFAVIFNHTPRSSYFLFTTREPGSLLYFGDLAASIGCKFAVPTFLAISGAMMLDREISLKKLWIQRIPKTVLMLAAFSLFSHLIGAAAGNELLGIKDLIFRAYDQDLNYSYWYLYAYIAFLIASPMLSTLLRNLKNRELLYMIGVALFFRSVLPAFEQLRWGGEHHLTAYFSLAWLTADIVLYPTIGYFLHCRMDIRTCSRALPFLWLAAAVGIYVSCWLTWQEYQRLWITHIETYHKLFDGVYAAAIFVTVRVLYEHVSGECRLGRLTAVLGSSVLGVYLLHVPVMDHTRLFQDLIWVPMDALGLPQLICGMSYVLIMFFACAVLAWILKKIPGIRWLMS